MAGRVLKSSSGWKNNGNGTDDYSFSALPVGTIYDNGVGADFGNFSDFFMNFFCM